MINYKESLLSAIKAGLIYIPIAIFLVFVIVKVIININKILTDEYKKEDANIRKWILICAACFIAIILGTVIPSLTILGGMGIDYINDDFETTEGYITDSQGAKGLSGCYIVFYNDKYFLTQRDEDVLKENMGRICEVTYGARSKFIVDYEVISKPLGE